MTRQQFGALALAARDDPGPLIQSCFRIRTKGLPGQLPVDLLRFNNPQQKIHAAIVAQRKAGRPPRVIVLKARQPGVSTLAAAYAASSLLTFPFCQTMVVAHSEAAARGLFEKTKFMLAELPGELRPFVKTDRREELVLRGVVCDDGEVTLNTAHFVGTATGEELWRGKTLQFVHISEHAQFLRGEEVLIGALQAVPTTPQSLVILESTARGMGNSFEAEWKRATAGESEFAPVFIGWWELPDATMPVPKDFALEPEERALKKAFGLSDEQVQWRRYAIHTQCAGDTELFDQEFPSSPEVAFLVSGRPAFHIPTLREMYAQAEKLVPLRQRPGTYPAQGIIGLEAKFHPLAKGPCTIFVPPHPDHEYVLAADVAAGVEGGDYSCAQVFDRTAEEQVAIWHGHLTPVQFAHVCSGLATLYNQALLAPELTGGLGLSVVEELKAIQYPRLYIWIRHDKVKGTTTNYFGWETSWKTRPLLINSLANAILERSLRLRDPATILELMEFQYVEGRRAEGLHHDDRALALMIAYRVHLEYPIESTGLPPRFRMAEEAKVETGPPVPVRALDREAWEEVDRERSRMEVPKGTAAEQYGAVDVGEEQLDGEWLNQGW